jgi:DNA polymerase III sliding clamp (beta) subunit (PCNA family)
MKKIDLTQKKAKNSPQGGVLVGKKEGQTIIYDDAKVGGWFVGKTHKEGGIQGIDKTTGQPIEVQTGEVIITAPALADQTPREFEGKMMTNREILSKINSDAGGVALAEDGMEISNKALYKGGQYNYGGKMMSDKDIFDEINKCGCEHEEKNNLSEGMSLEDIAKKHNVSLDDLHKQVEIGMKDESIHTGDYKDHFNIVKDHLVENPTFYTDEQKAQGEFANGGLIAPNGKPSGLYFTEVYNLVRTKEFKEWFGDWEEAYKTKDYDGVSKIIDENGEPLICVHNSPNEFFEFDEYKVGSTTDAGYYGKGFYFFPNVGFDKYGEIEYNCFLNIKNPYFKQSSHRNYELKTDELKNESFDGVVVYPNFNEDFNFENGVDKAEEIVAYYSEQIKLGDGTNTTFDKYNNDIRFDDGGMFNTESFLNYYFEEIAEFLKNQNDIILNKDFTFKFKGENFKIEPIVMSDKIIKKAYFSIIDLEDEVVGEIEFNPKNKKQFIAESDFFNWKNLKFYKGGIMKKENLVKDAKDGNTPARDLNNYNDMLDVQADGEVGGNTGIYADGGGVGKALTPTISNWNDVPSIWKNTSKVKKVTWSNNPYDKGLYSIVAPFLGEDKLRPIMTGINFDENGITCTDAHLMITLPYPNKEFEGVYNADLSKKKDSEQITIDGKYPNYSAVIPSAENTTPYFIDVYKLLQYTKVAINYAYKGIYAVQFKISDGILSINGKFLVEVLTTLLKLGHEKGYAHFSGFNRPLLFSPAKDYELGNDEILLSMPFMVQNQNLGALDLDYNRELSVYYDFNDNEIHNADGSVAEFRMTYENNAVVSKEDVKLFEDMIKKSKNRLAILDYVVIEDSVARSTNLYSDYELKGVNLPNGIYKADKGTLEITMEAIEDFPTKPIFEVDENTIQFVIPSPVLEYYLDKLKFVVGKDDLRPVMMGICLHHTSDNKLYLASTDAHILLKIDITKYVDMPIYNKDIKTIIDPKSIYDFLNTIEESALHIKSNRIATKIDSEKWSLYSRNIDGNFPNYDAVIPRESNKLLSIDLEQLRKCIDSDFTKKYERESKNKDGIFVFNKENEIYIATDIGYREKEIEGIEKLCETNVDSKTQQYQYRDENILLIMPVTYGEQTNFCFGKRILQRVINIVNDKKLEMHYSEFNRPYLVKIDSFVYEKTTKEHKIKEQKLTQKNLEQIAELDDLKEVLEPSESADNNELNEAIETLEILLESAKGKDKKEIKEAIEILKMLK